MAPGRNKKANQTHGDEFFKKRRPRAEIKHGVMRIFLQAFFAIMAQQNGIDTILAVDAFAGPGYYEDTNDGSPLVMCKTLLEHSVFVKHPHLLRKINLVFLELDAGRANELRRILRPFQVKGLQIEVVQGQFKNKILGIMDTYNADANFVFADPFGYSGMSMDILRKILTYPRTDLLVNLMDGPIRRWRTTNDKKKILINELLGSEEWQSLEQSNFLEDFVNLYQRKLEDPYQDTETGLVAGKAWTVRFAMKNDRNAHVYHLVCAASHLKGLKAMKAAMYKNSGLRNGFMFSEFNPKTNAYRDLMQKEGDSKENAKEVAELVKETFKDFLLVNGIQIENFITGIPNYHFNFKCALKEELSPYLLTKGCPSTAKFTELMYSFIIEPPPAEIAEATTNKPLNVSNAHARARQTPVKRKAKAPGGGTVLAAHPGTSSTAPKKFKPSLNKKPVWKGKATIDTKQRKMEEYFKRKA